MKKFELPCLYYPTTAVIIDDDEIFLKNTALELDSDIHYKTYQDPLRALNDLKKLKSQNKLLSHAITLNTDDSLEGGQYPMNLNISSIFKEAYNKNPYEEVSVVVVDYSMPQMNGAHLLEQLVDIPIQKITLTGQADEAFAVKLFNDGIIDKFIPKGSQSLKKTLNESIQDLRKKYFHGLSDIILKSLSLQSEFYFFDPAFIKFFNHILAGISIPSYYLIETSGSFLILDHNASPTWLLVRSEDETLEFAQQAEAEGAPMEIVNPIKNGEKISYFNDFDEYVDATQGHWEKYLYPAKELLGEKKYRYALANNLPGFPLNKDKILSFNEYLKSSLSAQHIK
ncbi:MAG TPA: hypothetical protein VHE99_11575 [Gammaproteobacteria bacterium]|nr:hypothetical protein [Gammaproteobacteria bacterium]